MRMEKEPDGLLQLHRLQHLKDGTLLQTLTPEHEVLMLPRQRVIRLMRRDTNGKLEVFSTQPSDYSHDALLAQRWLSMPLPHFLKEGMHDPLVNFVKNSVEAWVQDTIDYAPDEGDLLSGGIEAMNLGEKGAVLTPAKAPPGQPQYPVQDLGFPDEEETDSDSRPNSIALVDAEACLDSNILIDFEGRPPSSSLASHLVGPTHTPAPGSVNDSTFSGSMQTRLTPGISYADKRPRAQWENTPIHPVLVSYNAQPAIVYTGDVATEPFPPLGTQAPRPRVQRLQSASSAPVAPPGLSTRQGQYSEAVLAQSAEPTDIEEKLQVEDEVATRRYFPTTAHRKPKSKVKGKPSKSSFKVELGLPDWDPRSNKQSDLPDQSQAKTSQIKVPAKPPTIPQVLPDCSKDLLQILDNVRAFRGYLDMEVSIGRTLIEGLRGPEAREFAASKPMPPRRMAGGLKEHLSLNESTKLYFVERLTSSTVEACQIHTPQLFHQEAVEECWYEFHCEDKYHNQFIVKVKAVDDAQIELVPATIGQIFFHYPKRKWDARFAVNGRKPYTHRKAVKEFMEKLSAEVRDSKDGRLVDLRFRMTSNLKIISAYTKKRLSFGHINNERITLHLTEVQDLIRGWMRDDTSLHQFASRERAEMIEARRLWYEAKMSISAKSFFDENLKTKAGDDAVWDAKDVLDDKMLSDIQSVVDRVIIRMDGVGVLNKGWRGGEEDMVHLEEFEQQNKKNVRPDFW
jgi:hypothetical protein